MYRSPGRPEEHPDNSAYLAITFSQLPLKCREKVGHAALSAADEAFHFRGANHSEE